MALVRRVEALELRVGGPAVGGMVPDVVRALRDQARTEAVTIGEVCDVHGFIVPEFSRKRQHFG